MTARDVLAAIESAGIRLEVRGETLRVDAPAGRVTPELRAALAAHKATLLRILRPGGFVTLKGGLTVPVAALQLALDLEARGIPLATDVDHQFIVPDDPRLTADDRAGIQQWYHHLGAIVEYQAPEPIA
jgi:hypothetical protein